MDSPRSALRIRREAWPQWAGAATSVVLALVLYTRFSIDGSLNRDESIYAYGGQQLTHGVPPYASIFDPKGPLATMLCGLGAGLGNLLGRNEIYLIRLVFLGCSVLTVLAVYLLVLQLWDSVIGGLTAAVVFASFDGFARNALPGPDAKTPGVLFLVLCMWLAVRRQWFLAAFAGSLAFLVWQPLLIFVPMVLLYAVLCSPENRRGSVALAVAGAAVPLAVTFVYFAAVGAVGKFVESAFTYPLTWVKRTRETFLHRIRHIADIVHRYYEFSGVLFWLGAALLVAVAVGVLVAGRRHWRTALTDPLLCVIMLSFLFEAGYASTDFQSYPDLFPLLPYPAIGFGAAVAIALSHCPSGLPFRIAFGVTATAAALLALLSAVWFTNSSADNTDLRREEAAGCALQQAVLPGTTLYSIGNPVPLVVTGRRNPDRYIYLDSGVDVWKVEHTAGGFAGWTAQIQASRPSVVVLEGWRGKYRTAIWEWLVSQGYHRRFVGPFRVFVTHAARLAAPSNGIKFTPTRTKWPEDPHGGRFTRRDCGIA